MHAKAFSPEPGYVESFMEGPKLYIVMEYADNGDLATQIKRRSDAQGHLSSMLQGSWGVSVKASRCLLR